MGRNSCDGKRKCFLPPDKLLSVDFLLSGCQFTDGGLSLLKQSDDVLELSLMLVRLHCHLHNVCTCSTTILDVEWLDPSNLFLLRA